MVWREWESNTTLLISTVLFLHINKLVAFHLLPNERLESLHEVVFNRSSLCSIRNDVYIYCYKGVSHCYNL